MRIHTALVLLVAGLPAFADGPALDSFAPETERVWHHEGAPTFSLRFPWTWQRNAEVRPPVVLEVAEDQVPRFQVMVMDEPWWLPQALSVRAAATRLEGGNTEVVETGSTTLPDGSEADTGLVRWRMAHIGLGIPLQTWFVSVFRDGHWVLSSLTIPDHGQAFPEELQAVAASVEFAAAD